MYYRPHRQQRQGAVTVGLLPLDAGGFLGWIFVKSLGQRAAEPALVADRNRRRRAGPDVFARFILRFTFFQIPRKARSARTGGYWPALRQPDAPAVHPLEPGPNAA